jgi:hypothetical protein
MRKPVWKIVLIGLVVLFAGIQLVPGSRSNPPVTSRMAASPAAQDVLKRACYDCHSNETTWPWYSRVAPVSWWVAGHVSEGRDELNFSEWASTPQQLKRLGKTPKEIAKGEMPPWYYRLAHREARLSEADIAALNGLAAAPAAAASSAPVAAAQPAETPRI